MKKIKHLSFQTYMMRRMRDSFAKSQFFKRNYVIRHQNQRRKLVKSLTKYRKSDMLAENKMQRTQQDRSL